MPLRDHFRPPVELQVTWQGFHAYWPAVLMNHFYEILPEGYSVEPRVQIGHDYEVDIGAVEQGPPSMRTLGRGVATLAAPKTKLQALAAAVGPPAATTRRAIKFIDPYEYEVQVYNERMGRTLVAAVELVSPGNQDRPDHREKFLNKCEALIAKGVCVSMIDIVTTKRFNLHADLLGRFDVAEAAFADEVPSIYVATARHLNTGRKSRLESWAYPLAVGRPIPSLPIWLNWETLVMLDVEATYEKACKDMRIA
jgi:hypothetical protein